MKNYVLLMDILLFRSGLSSVKIKLILPPVIIDIILWVKESPKHRCPQQDEPPFGALCKRCEVSRLP